METIKAPIVRITRRKLSSLHRILSVTEPL